MIKTLEFGKKVEFYGDDLAELEEFAESIKNDYHLIKDIYRKDYTFETTEGVSPIMTIPGEPKDIWYLEAWK